MKKIFKIIIITLIMMPFIVSAEVCTNAETVIKSYLKNPTYEKTYKLYLIDNSGELLDKRIYERTKLDKNNEGTSYLFDGYNYCVVENGTKKTILQNNVEKAKVRIVEAVKPGTKVSGKGSYQNPWTFSSNYLINISSNEYGEISLNNSTTSSRNITVNAISDDINEIKLYAKDKYKYIGNNCGESFEYNSETNSIHVSNITHNIKCEIYFGKEIYKINLRDTTNTYEYISEVNPKDLYVSPKVGWYSDAGTTTSISKITLPQIKGYLFKGYTNASGEEFINASGEIISGKTEIFSGNSTAKIKTTPITYKIEYNANGGSGTMTTSENINYGSSYTLTANTFTKAGYTFNGWNTKADGSGTSYANQASVSNLTTTNGATITLYAKWTVNYTAYFHYTGKFKVSKSGSVMQNTSYSTTNSNWSVWFLTNGELTTYIDMDFNAFLVGGGSGGNNGNANGGAGGYTKSSSNLIHMASGSKQSISIGNGGANGGGAGGTTTAFNLTANGGNGRTNGTGAGGTHATCNPFAPGGPANDGVYAFGDSSIDGIMYGAGGGGGGCNGYNGSGSPSFYGGGKAGSSGGGAAPTHEWAKGGAGSANTGGGGAGGVYCGTCEGVSQIGGAGGSGIVIIKSQSSIIINGSVFATYTGGTQIFTYGGKTFIKFLSDGKLTMKKNQNISAFLVGGGAAGSNGNSNGGAGGYTTTISSKDLTSGTSYDITIGTGGIPGGGAGGATTAFGSTAKGGSGRTNGTGAGGTASTCSGSSWTSGAAGGSGVYAFGNSSIDGIKYGAGGGGGSCNAYNGAGNAAFQKGSAGGSNTGGEPATYESKSGGSGTNLAGGGGAGGSHCGTCGGGDSAGGYGGTGVVIIRLN